MIKQLQSHRLLALQPCRLKLPQKSEKFLARKNKREWKVIETFCSSKGYPGHVESKNDNHAKNLFQKMSKFISNFIYSSKSSAGAIDCILIERQKKFRGTLESFTLKVQQNQVLWFLFKHFFLRKILWAREMQFLKSSKAFMPSVTKFLDETQKPK